MVYAVQNADEMITMGFNRDTRMTFLQMPGMGGRRRCGTHSSMGWRFVQHRPPEPSVLEELMGITDKLMQDREDDQRDGIWSAVLENMGQDKIFADYNAKQAMALAKWTPRSSDSLPVARVRRISTYNGHGGCERCLRRSPDSGAPTRRCEIFLMLAEI